MKIFIYTFRQGLVIVTIFDTADLSIQHLLQTYERITYTEKWLAFIWQKKPKMLTVRSSILSHLLKYSVNLVKQKNLKRKRKKEEKKGTILFLINCNKLKINPLHLIFISFSHHQEYFKLLIKLISLKNHFKYQHLTAGYTTLNT